MKTLKELKDELSALKQERHISIKRLHIVNNRIGYLEKVVSEQQELSDADTQQMPTIDIDADISD